jgi:sulfur carrier protein ThiS
MRIKLRALGTIRQYTDDVELEVEPNITCGSLLKNLKLPEFGILVFVNGVSADLNKILNEPCEVTILTLVRGG